MKLRLLVALLSCGLCLSCGVAWGADCPSVSRTISFAMQKKKADKKKEGKKREEKKKKKKRRETSASFLRQTRDVPVLSEEEQRRFNYYFLEASRQKALQNYDVALEMLRHCLAINPHDAVALFETVIYYDVFDQVPQAISTLEQAVAYEPDNYWFCQGLASLYLKHDLQKGKLLLEEMVERFPYKQDPIYTLLSVYDRESEYDKVIDLLNLLEERTGKSEQISMEKFRIYQQQHDNRRAFEEIQTLVDEYPMEMRYRVILGDVHLQNDNPDEAYRIYREVLQEEPDNVQAMYSLASYYEQTGQTELYNNQLDSLLLNRKLSSEIRLQVMRQVVAQGERQESGRDSLGIIRLFDRMAEQETDNADPLIFYARYLLSKEMGEKAIPVLSQALDIDPANNAARMTLLGDAVRRQDNKATIRLCEGGVEASPETLEFYFYLAIGYNQDERTDDVIDICRRALKRVTSQSDKEMVSDFYTILGDSYHTLKQDDQAYLAYDSALVYNPANIGALNNYAYYLSLERRDLDKAEEMSYRTVKADPDNATYLDTYAWILFEKGRYAEARLFIDDAMRGEGAQSEVIVEHCGDIYYMTGEVEQAVKYWRQSLDMGNTSEKLKQKISRRRYVE